LLQDLLKAKFGTLPDWALQRLEAASVATLRQLSVAVLRASTIEEVLREATEDTLLAAIEGKPRSDPGQHPH